MPTAGIINALGCTPFLSSGELASHIIPFFGSYTLAVVEVRMGLYLIRDMMALAYFTSLRPRSIGSRVKKGDRRTLRNDPLSLSVLYVIRYLVSGWPIPSQRLPLDIKAVYILLPSSADSDVFFGNQGYDLLSIVSEA